MPLGAMALHVPLAHDAVACVLPGPRDVGELDGILAWAATDIGAAV